MRQVNSKNVPGRLLMNDEGEWKYASGGVGRVAGGSFDRIDFDCTGTKTGSDFGTISI
jgi:hypothetical protein